MYDIQEGRIRRTTAEIEPLLAETIASVEETIRAPQREEHRAVARLWDARSGAYRYFMGMVAK